MPTGIFNGHEFEYDRMFEDFENIFFDENDKLFIVSKNGSIVPLFSSGGKCGKRKGQKLAPIKVHNLFFSELNEEKVAIGLKQYGGELVKIKDETLYVEHNDRVFKIGFSEKENTFKTRLYNAFHYNYEVKPHNSKQVIAVKLGRPTIEDVQRFDDFEQAGKALGITEEQAKDACEKRKQVNDYTIMSVGYREGDAFYDNGVC